MILFVYMVLLPLCAACVLLGYEIGRLERGESNGDGGGGLDVPDFVPDDWTDAVRR